VFSTQNELLAALPAAEREQIAAHLKRVPLPRTMVLHETGQAVERVYFPESGAVSLVVDLKSGEIIETGLVGVDGAVAGIAAIQEGPALNKAIVQIEGAALAIAAEVLRKVAVQGSTLRTLLDRHDQFLYAQAQQSAACNAAHSLEARLSRWLLRANDLCGRNFMLTQESLAAFLGVRRTSVSLTAHGLQEAGIIRYRRGVIEIVDLERLRKTACECHTTLAAQRERLRPRERAAPLSIAAAAS
jgi:CRP-like cAMP-binding protein